ncbi:MAG: ABC transporter ATP-binding protein [Planctomycetaceae bacterium]
MDSTPLIELRNVQKRFGAVTAVNGVSLSVAKGEFVSLLGPSGCGKTSTLNLIAGFSSIDSGEILIDGRSMNSVPPNKRNLGMVFQSYALFPHLTVLENIRFGLRMAGVPRAVGTQRALDALALVRLDGFGGRGIHELSGGQRQRVALARAIVTKPLALLLDEPLSALDANLREEMRGELREIQQTTGISTVLVTHDQEEALALSDKIVVMRGGSVEQVGTPREIYYRSTNVFVANFVGETNFFDVTISKADGQSLEGTTQSGMRIVAHPKETVGQGDVVRFAIRPEAVRLDTDSLLENSYEARVEQVTFLGQVTRAKLSLGTDEFSLRLTNSDTVAPVAEGDLIRVGWNRENVQVLHDR